MRELKQDLSTRIELDPVWLDRQILNLDDEPLRASTQAMVRGAFRGLLALRGFDAAVAYQVVEKNGQRHLSPANRIWGEIYLEGDPKDVVAGFSHDTRYDNDPYVNLYQWVEQFERGSNRLSDVEFARFEESWASPVKWEEFFRSRIGKNVANLRKETDGFIGKAALLTARASKIERQLSV